MEERINLNYPTAGRQLKCLIAYKNVQSNPLNYTDPDGTLEVHIEAGVPLNAALIPVIDPSDISKHASLIRRVKGIIRIDRPKGKHNFWHFQTKIKRKDRRIPFWPGPKEVRSY